MNFKTREDYEEYREKAQSELNRWAKENPLPGIGIGKDEYGNVVQITTANRMKSLIEAAENDSGVAHTVEQSPVIERPSPKSEPGCKTCAAKGLKRLILGGAKLLKSELGIDASDEKTVNKRKELCLSCDRYDFGVCSDCGCFCAAKVKLTSEKCPIGKW